jgi:hypothetical protein
MVFRRVAALFNKPRYASAEAASALPGFLCFVQRHIACV